MNELMMNETARSMSNGWGGNKGNKSAGGITAVREKKQTQQTQCREDRVGEKSGIGTQNKEQLGLENKKNNFNKVITAASVTVTTLQLS